MEYIGNKKKQGSIVELLRDEILAGNIPDGSEMTRMSWQKVWEYPVCQCGKR